MAQHGGPGTGVVWGGVTPCLDAPAQASDPSLGSLAPATLSFCQTNLSHPSLPATCSCPVLTGGYRGLLRTAAEIRFGCGENFLLPCVIFQLDQFPGLAHGDAAWAGMWREGFPGAGERQGRERCRDAESQPCS